MSRNYLLGDPSGNWKKLTGKLQDRLGKAAIERRVTANARRRALNDKLQQAYGISREEADKEIADWGNTIRRARMEQPSIARAATTRTHA
ncbi:MAG: hypothetical protein H7Y02_09580 [Candidatus Obscuribacterales bacterium]|nr:hypothetical protein [Steroidobacteraceae bacterium]